MNNPKKENRFFRIIKVLGAVGVSILTIYGLLSMLAGEPLTCKELWFRLLNTDNWIECDKNFISDNRHFTYVGEQIGTCTINLKPGEFIVGSVDNGFQESIFQGIASDRCAAFVFIGPIKKTFSMYIAGGGDYYYATSYNEDYFKEKWNELDSHPTCNQSSRGYDKIECNQSSECIFLPQN